MDELEALKQWIGRKESGVDYVTPPHVERLAATLDMDSFAREGEAMPRGWHARRCAA